MIRPLAFLSAIFAVSTLPAAAAELIRKPSPYSVSETVDRLETAVTKAGATVFARVNHGGGAKKVGLELADAELLIFGNPKLGTPALQADLDIGLDLPLRVLVAKGDNGVEVIYRDPSELVSAYDIPADAPVLQKMTGALGKLTSAAVAE